MREQKSNQLGIAPGSPYGINNLQFSIPKFARDILLTSSSLPEFLTLFSLHKKFAEENRGKTQLTNVVTIAEIARISLQDTKDPQTPGKIQAALEHLKKENVIDFVYLPKKYLKQLDLTKSVGVLQRKHGKEIWEVDQSNYHAAIFYEFVQPPIVEPFETSNKKRQRQLQQHTEKNSIPINIPSNLCVTVKEIVQRTKANRNALSLHKLALYVATITNISKLPISLSKINEIIGFDAKKSKCSKAYNINLISNMLEQLTSSGFIKGYEKPDMTNPSFFLFPGRREPSDSKSENIKRNRGNVRNQEAENKSQNKSQAVGNKSQVLNAFAPESKSLVIKKPILKQQVKVSVPPA
jgi:hypothetical protein